MRLCPYTKIFKVEEVMDRLKRLFYFLIIIAGTTAQVFGGGQDKAGTNSAPELQIPIGSRYIAMGGADISSSAGLESIYWNPAGADYGANSANMMFSYRKYFADMSFNYFAASAKFDLGTIAVSLRNLNVGDINVTSMDHPDGTGQIITPTYFVLGLTYSKALTDRISIGVNMNWIDESWANVAASGVSFDFGVQYRNLLSVPNLNLGIVVKNLGPSLKYGGSGLWIQATDPASSRGTTFYEVGAGSFELPSSVSLGLSYSNNFDEVNKLTVATSFVNNNFTYDEIRVGGEYSFRDLIYLRLGYIYSPGSTSDVPNIYQNYTAGFGINFASFSGLDITLDYAYIPVKYFDANQSVTVRMGF
jgi:hypothetical protein